MKNKIFSLITTLAMLCSLVGVMPIVKVSAQTESDVVSWMNSKNGTTINDGGTQCVAAFNSYLRTFDISNPIGNYPVRYAYQIFDYNAPSGWEKISGSGNYRVGDVVIWDSSVGKGCGHVGMVYSTNGTVKIFDQNWVAKNKCGIHDISSTSAIRGVFRPNLENSIIIYDVNEKYRVSTSSGANLRVRSTYSTSGSIVTEVANGTEFVISKRTSTNWGYCDSLGGWLCLDYCTQIPFDTTPPVIDDVSVKDISPLGYTVSCRVTDKESGIDRVLFPTWSLTNGQDDITWSLGTDNGNGYYSFVVKISDHNNDIGNYVTHIYAYDKCENGVSAAAPTIYIENTPPKISDVKIIDVTSEGYTVRCTVTDEGGSGIDRVQFPTWTLANDQDDINPSWVTSSSSSGDIDGNIVTFRVNISDHNNEMGIYRTHIYAYDKSGNSACVAVDDVMIENEAPVISDVEVIDVTPEGYTVKCKFTDKSLVTGGTVWVRIKDRKGNILDSSLVDPVEEINNKDGICSYRVKKGEYKNNNVIYETYFSIYDEYGNTSQLWYQNSPHNGVKTIPDVILPEYGDINKDEKINVSDAVSIQEYLVNKQTFTKEQFAIADMNSDGKVDVFDMIILKRRILKSN